ncbi:hypothetical protein Celaphus_00015255, partial [Cervus elaphus hippelaphus]
MADSLCAAQRARRAANQQAARSCLWPGCLQPIIPFPLAAICDIPFLSAETFWELGNWTHCSATCGHLGAQVQRPQCLMANGQEVSEAFCDQLRKPRAAFQPCNIRDCPPRWLTGTWSECSVSCGEGFRSRQVTCKRTRANGTVQALPPRVCIPRDRPLGRRPCSSHPCVQGLVEQGNQ